MTDLTKDIDPNGQPDAERRAAAAPEVEDDGIPKPHDRTREQGRKIRGAIERMIEKVHNPYEMVMVAATEARRLNGKRLRARSILTQAMEQAEELVPDVPFVPRPVEDEEPEVKTTTEAIERLALGMISYNVDGETKESPTYLEGGVDSLKGSSGGS